MSSLKQCLKTITCLKLLLCLKLFFYQVEIFVKYKYWTKRVLVLRERVGVYIWVDSPSRVNNNVLLGDSGLIIQMLLFSDWFRVKYRNLLIIGWFRDIYYSNVIFTGWFMVNYTKVLFLGWTGRKSYWCRVDNSKIRIQWIYSQDLIFSFD